MACIFLESMRDRKLMEKSFIQPGNNFRQVAFTVLVIWCVPNNYIFRNNSIYTDVYRVNISNSLLMQIKWHSADKQAFRKADANYLVVRFLLVLIYFSILTRNVATNANIPFSHGFE